MGRRTSQYSLHFSMVCLTFFMLNSTFYMVNTTFHMANYSLFIWSTNHFLYGQLITFYMVNTTSLCAQTQTKGAYHWTKNSGVNFSEISMGKCTHFFYCGKRQLFQRLEFFNDFKV